QVPGHEADAAQGRWVLRLNSFQEVEPTLATLRESGALIDDIELNRADLEDVFVQIMHNEERKA
ncbi:hypothetical protein ABTN14_19210, partial [Acinetobacter baumannii]